MSTCRLVFQPAAWRVDKLTHTHGVSPQQTGLQGDIQRLEEEVFRAHAFLQAKFERVEDAS